ncbi:MAG: LLM class flavin-dependent oxidoreductase [Candidatus Dormibacteraceae bacterium]
MTEERTAIIIHDAVPLPKVLELARRADEKGFWGVFMTEEAGHDTQVALGGVAGATRQAWIGSGISSVFTRSPAIYAMAANTINTLSHGRFILGLGTSPPFYVKHWHGAAWERPVGRIKDYVRIVRGILERPGKIHHHGNTINCDDFILAVERPSNHIPIWVGALGPQMIEAAGEVGDGALLSPIITEEYLEFALERVQRGAQRASRNWREVEIAAPVVTVVDPDEQQALDQARSMLTYFAVVYYFEPVFAPSGHRDVWEALNRTNKEKGYEAARDLVPDEVVRKFTICGTPDQCRSRIAQLRQAGLGVPVLNAPGPRRIFGQAMRVPVPTLALNEAIIEYLA